MPALFAALAGAASSTIDAVFAEGFLLQPTALPNVGAVVDVNARRGAGPVGTVIAFEGVWIAPGAMLHAHGRQISDSTTRPIISEKPMIDVDVRAFTSRPQQGWRITRRDTGERYEITAYVPVDLGRALIHLAELRAP